MKKSSIILLISLSILFITGTMAAGKSYLDQWFNIELTFISISTLMKWHGAFTMIALITGGKFINDHILIHIKNKTNRKSGLILVGTLFTLSLTGYFLYYAGNQTFREINGYIHTSFGVALLGIVLYHAGPHLTKKRRRN